MKMEDISFTKTKAEQYDLRFNNGLDWAYFMLSDNGALSCISSFGDYNHKWNSFGSSLKEFITQLNTDSIINCFSKRDYFDYDEYQERTITDILDKNRNKFISDDVKQHLLEFIDQISDDTTVIIDEIYNSMTLKTIYANNVTDSPFYPTLSFSPNALAFANDVFPAFQEIIRKELNLYY